MLILFRPYKLNDYVDIGGTAGTVKDINLFITELATPDNVQIIVPNGQAWGSIISNYSHHSTRRVDLVFGISYDDDAGKAMEIIRGLAAAESRVKADPEPWLRVTNLGDSSVDITARLWVEAADYWDVKFALTQAVKEAFDANGITIPYPTRVMVQAGG
jgi:small conductance mechanosensitive channel